MSMKYIQKEPLEAYTRYLIENKLNKLGYNLDEKNTNCNIYRERAKMKYQDDLLNGKNPDFLIYESGTDRILAIIEAKRPSMNLDDAIQQALNFYAIPLNIPIIFVYNGNSFYSCTKDLNPIKIDKIEINDFVDEKTLIKLIENNYDIDTIPTYLSTSKENLIQTFKKANNLLRKAGLRDGYERFSVFSDLLFLKLKNDFDDYGTTSLSDINIDKNCNWQKLISKTPKYMGKTFTLKNSEVKIYLEDIIKPKLKAKYGDVFESSLNINDESILIELLELIDDINFSSIDSDVKGDAFEFFLRNVTNGNKDLGEYYTPRHIVKMIVKFLNPTVGDKIYDPCCGTGGLLLECFKYLIKNSDVSNPEIKRKIKEESIYGSEITSTARIAKMNMILFGDGHSNIAQLDSLSRPINEEYNVIVSNIPYSQNVEYGDNYHFPSANGDSIFVQHMWQALKPGGRMAVIVPDTFLYEDNETYKCRKWIIDNSSKLIIVSLPRGVFNPYTPTKTSIVFATKKNIDESFKKLSDVYFYVIDNDGFELGAKRRPIKGISDCNKFLMDYNEEKELRTICPPKSTEVDITNIISKNYNLFPYTYMEHLPENCKKNQNNLVSIGAYIQEKNQYFNYESYNDKDEECAILSVTKNGIYINEICTVEDLNNKSQKYKKVFENDMTYNPHRINIGSIGVVPNLHPNMYVPQIYPVFSLSNEKNLPPYYLLKLLKTKNYQQIINHYCLGGARANLKLEWLGKIKMIKPSETELAKYQEFTKELNLAYNKYINLLKKIYN